MYSLQVAMRGLVCTGMSAEVLLGQTWFREAKETGLIKESKKTVVLQKLPILRNNEEEEDGN